MTAAFKVRLAYAREEGKTGFQEQSTYLPAVQANPTDRTWSPEVVQTQSSPGYGPVERKEMRHYKL